MLRTSPACAFHLTIGSGAISSWRGRRGSNSRSKMDSEVEWEDTCYLKGRGAIAANVKHRDASRSVSSNEVLVLWICFQG